MNTIIRKPVYGICNEEIALPQFMDKYDDVDREYFGKIWGLMGLLNTRQHESI